METGILSCRDDFSTKFFSYVISHYQFGVATREQRARIDLMSFLTSEPAFDFLRTKNTLGYVCFSMAPAVKDYAGFSLIARDINVLDLILSVKMYFRISERSMHCILLCQYPR